MLLSKLLLLPVALASSVTIYMQSIPPHDSNAAVIASAIPVAQISYETGEETGTVTSFTPPSGSYSPDHLLRIGLHDSKTKSWRGIVTSAASFEERYKKNFVVHVDEKGTPYHVGFSASAKEKGGKDVEVEIVKRGVGPKPVLNKPIQLNAEGKLDSKEPEKTFFQKYWWAIALFLLVQVVAGGGKE